MSALLCPYCTERQAQLVYMRRTNPPDIQARLERYMRAPGVNCFRCELREQYQTAEQERLNSAARLRELEAQSRTSAALLVELTGDYHPEPRPVRFTRRPLVQDSLLVWGVYRLCRLVKNTAITSQDGHKILWSWFLYRGELSRADGWRALAALSYVTITWLAVWAVVYSVLMVVF